MTGTANGRVTPIQPGEATNDLDNELLADAESSWWQDPRMWGVIAKVPGTLQHWVSMIFHTADKVDPVTWELMALRGAFVTGCHY